jgi:hypothetical protein
MAMDDTEIAKAKKRCRRDELVVIIGAPDSK